MILVLKRFLPIVEIDLRNIIGLCVLLYSSSATNGQTWYDSEGRPVSMVDGEITRGKAVISKEEPKTVSPIIPLALVSKQGYERINFHRTYWSSPYAYCKNYLGLRWGGGYKFRKYNYSGKYQYGFGYSTRNKNRLKNSNRSNSSYSNRKRR